MAYTEEELKKELESKEYEYGFYTDIESDTFPKGISEEIVIAISRKKEEPAWMTEWRLNAFRHWKTLEEPDWSNVHYPKIDYNEISYYSAPRTTQEKKSLDEVDPELLETYEKLGIPEAERKYLAGVTAQYESEVVYHRNREDLEKLGVLFTDMDTAVREYPDIVKVLAVGNEAMVRWATSYYVQPSVILKWVPQ